MNTITFNQGPMHLLSLLGWFLIAYAFGAIPTAWLLCKLVTKQDLRYLGSGNVGVMNTAYSVARWAGVLVFLGEIAKGIMVVTVPRYAGAGESVIPITILGAVAGVRWPIWLHFKGGRANTTGFSALFMISYLVPAVMLTFWTLIWLLVRNTFQASRLTFFTIPLALGLATRSYPFVLVGIALSAIYISAQRQETDDHLLISKSSDSLWKFLIQPRHKRI